MENLKPAQRKTIKDISNIFRLKKELNYTAVKDIRNLFRLEKEAKAIKDRILRDIQNLLEHEEEEIYYKRVRVSNFRSNNYIECKSNDDVKKHYHLKNNIISNLKKSDTWKIQLPIANNFISSIDNDEECVM